MGLGIFIEHVGMKKKNSIKYKYIFVIFIKNHFYCYYNYCNCT